MTHHETPAVSTATYLRTRVEPTRRMGVLAVGDAVAILAFAAAGVWHHGAVSVADPAVAVAAAAAPLLVAWGLVAFLGGLYTANAVTSPRRALSWSLPAWVVATLVGHALRATGPVPGGTGPTFVLVTLGVGGAFVIGWRTAAAALVGRV